MKGGTHPWICLVPSFIDDQSYVHNWSKGIHSPLLCLEFAIEQDLSQLIKTIYHMYSGSYNLVLLAPYCMYFHPLFFKAAPPLYLDG